MATAIRGVGSPLLWVGVEVTSARNRLKAVRPAGWCRVSHMASVRCDVCDHKSPGDPGSRGARIGTLGLAYRWLVSREKPIGEYLRARRELIRPEDAGLPAGGGRRRVAGLRREEVALLAGVSVDYYIRLEQGRDQHPSEQVLGAIARALQLDEDATAHLLDLAGPKARRRRPTPRPERPPEGIVQLIQAWTETPAYVEGRYLDVLAVNPLATALASYFTVGTNLLRAVFLDPHVHDMYQENWQRGAENTVAALRARIGPDVDDPRLNELVGELSVRSEHFRRVWARHDARPKRSGTARLRHPQVGPLELGYERLPIPGTDGQSLAVYHAAPGSPSARALALLASIAAGEHEPARTIDTHPHL